MATSNRDHDLREDIRTYISVNELVQVRIPDDPNSATYFSRINDVSEARLLIAWPTNGGIRLFVHRDQILDFFLMKDDVPHEFAGLVDEINADSPLPQLTIILSSPITRIQRRQNFRIKALVPLEVSGNIRDPRDGTETPVLIRTTTCDLSATGLAFRSAKIIPDDAQISIKLSLPDNAPDIRIPCRVVYSELRSDHQTLYRTGLHYLAVSESERARIVRFVYRTQLKGLRP